jgi:hypothetical protein
VFRTASPAVAVPAAVIARFGTTILLAVIAAVIPLFLLTAGFPVSFAPAAVAATARVAGAGIVTRGFGHNGGN